MLKKMANFFKYFAVLMLVLLLIPSNEVKAAEELGIFEIRGFFERVDRDKILQRVNEIRREAYEEGLANRYVPLKWSEGLEEVARLRCGELAIVNDHSRPNGNEEPFMETRSGVFHASENLAWNMNGAIYAIEQFYEEKADYVKEVKAGRNSQNSNLIIGHYESMINPDYKSMSMAAFLADGLDTYQISQQFSPDLDKKTISVEDYPDSVFFEAPLSFASKPVIKGPLNVKEGEEFDLDVEVTMQRHELIFSNDPKTIKVNMHSGFEVFDLPEGISIKDEVLFAEKAGNYKIEVEILKKKFFVDVKVLPADGKQEPKNNKVQRISGARREDVAAAVALKYFKDADAVLLVNNMTFGDAISASNLSQGKMPILYSAKNSIPKASLDAIDKIGPREIIMVGGPNSLSENIEKELRSKYGKVTRISGSDRYDVNNKTITAEKGPLYLVKGDIFTDALLAAPLAGANKGNVVLTRSNIVPDVLYKRIFEKGLGSSWTIVGGPNSISKKLMDSLKALPGGPGISRLSGADRYELSAQLGDKIPGKTAILVSGEVFSDAMVAAPLAQKLGAPIFLTASRNINPKVLDEMKDRDQVFILGGTNSVSTEVEGKIK